MMQIEPISNRNTARTERSAVRLEDLQFTGSSDLYLARLVFPLYRAAFGQPLSPHKESQQLEDLATHLADAERFRFKLSSNGATDALVLGKTIESSAGTVYYLAGILVAPKMQGQGLGTQILAHELKSTGASILALHTQSRRMLHVAEKLAIQNDSLISELAPLIGSRHPTGNIDKGRYGGERLYGNAIPAHELINGEVKIQEGDARIFIGTVRKETI